MSGNGERVTGNGEEGGTFEFERFDPTLFVTETSASYEPDRKPRDFRDLRVFAEARAFVRAVYGLSADFPKEERFGLTGQLRRASVSVVANIAEGNGRQYAREYVQFLSIAIGSARECQALLIVAEDLGFVGDSHDPTADLDRLIGMLHRLRQAIDPIGR